MIIYDDDSTLREVLKNNKFVILYFNSKNCYPCNVMSGWISALDIEYEDVAFVSINTELPNCEKLRKGFDVTGIPKLIFLKDEKVAFKLSGYKDKNILKTFIENLKNGKSD